MRCPGYSRTTTSHTWEKTYTQDADKSIQISRHVPIAQECVESTLPMLVLTRIHGSADPASTAEVARITGEPSKGFKGVNVDSSPAFSEDFTDLVHTQLSLLLEILRYGHPQSAVLHASKLSSQKETLLNAPLQAAALASNTLCSSTREFEHREP